MRKAGVKSDYVVGEGEHTVRCACVVIRVAGAHQQLTHACNNDRGGCSACNGGTAAQRAVGLVQLRYQGQQAGCF